ncbi:MAG: hypothetical protein COB66_09005 [Coxiella sp. (in: Bacteria)]|nr:MAG: hypothetical protein COB66_09005 [Coxiella sp. (in: g-proteobacteria)]
MGTRKETLVHCTKDVGTNDQLFDAITQLLARAPSAGLEVVLNAMRAARPDVFEQISSAPSTPSL